MKKNYDNFVRYYLDNEWHTKQVATYASAKMFCKFHEQKHGTLSCCIVREEVK